MNNVRVERESPRLEAAIRPLVWAERAIFFLIGSLLFGAALALVFRSAILLGQLFLAERALTITLGEGFLDLVLLILMVVELAYTVILSLRGAVLLAEPFLIVGLIAVIRRILVITVGEVNPNTTGPTGTQAALELLILTAVVLAFVFSIWLLRRGPFTAEERRERMKISSPPPD